MKCLSENTLAAKNNDKDFVVFDHVQKSYDGEVLVVKDLNLNIAKGPNDVGRF
jgi:putative spermidine/putrescine transport system ATP-binding protein